MKKLIAATIFTLFLTISNLAQVNDNLLLRDNPNDRKLETDYDKFKDKTKITLRLQVRSNLRLYLSDEFDGKTRTSSPTEITATFIASDRGEYFAYRYCIVLADDERIKLGNEKSMTASGSVFSVSIGLENLKKISNAKKVEIQAGYFEFRLSEAELKSIKEFYKQLIP